MRHQASWVGLWIVAVLFVAGCGSTPETVETFPEFDETDLVPDVPPSPPTSDVVPTTADHPGESAEWPSFELVIAVDDGEFGRVLYQSDTFWRADRTSSADGAVSLRFNRQTFGRNEWTAGGPEEGLFSSEGIPWQLLTTERTPEQVWDALETGTEPLIGDVTHPLARLAFTDGSWIVEMTDDGVPLVISKDGTVLLHVADMLERPIYRGEITRVGGGIFVDWANHLRTSTTPEQQSALADGLVTYAEYSRSADAAVSCAEEAGGQTSWSFDDESVLIEFQEADEALSDCLDRHFIDVADAWRVQTRWISADEGNLLFALINGDELLALVYSSEPGPEVVVASREGWTVWAWRRGPGICVRTVVRLDDGGHSSENCNLTQRWLAPGVGEFGASWRIADSGGASGDLSGVVSGDVQAVRVTFTDGDVVLYPVADVELSLGIGAFAGTFDPVAQGLPDSVAFLGANGEELATVDWLDRLCTEEAIPPLALDHCGP